MPNDDTDEIFRALAKLEGKTVEQLKQEMLRERLSSALGDEPRGRSAVALRPELPERSGPTQFGDASGAWREASLAREPQRRVAPRYEEERESPHEARERWLEEEAQLADGVHGFGGQTAGGIFGDGPIATDTYDPLAEQRAEQRYQVIAQTRSAQAVTQVAETVNQLASALGLRVGLLGSGGDRHALPPPGEQRLLGRGRQRRRGR